MALAAIALAIAAVALDGYLGSAWINDITWLFDNLPAGARAVLSTIAGSMITVAGVTFSMTIAALSFATGQIGPRLVSNFMRDRGNQVTLGTFIATFLYCLMVLRTVRSADETSDGPDAIGAFVPHVAILIALLLAAASVAVLIYFIHHISDSINISSIVSNIGRELNRSLETMFPDRLGDEADETRLATDAMPFITSEIAPVESPHDGYVVLVDLEALMSTAVHHDLVLRLEFRPGDFVTRGNRLLWAWPAHKVTEEVAERLVAAYAFGSRRTREQNLLFLVDELAEIIARALSPGVNDPYTAMTALDWMKSVLANLGRRHIPDPVRLDDTGQIRVIVSPVSYARFAGAIFDPIRPYVSADRNAALHALKILADLAAELRPGARRDVIMQQAAALHQAALEQLPLIRDREEIDRRYNSLAEVVADPKALWRCRDDQGWLGGSG
jgi:uncharacterized membrane protein